MPKLLPETERKRKANALAEFLNSTAHYSSEKTKLVTAEEVKALLPEPDITSKDAKTLEAEAILLYFDLQGKGFTRQECPECGKIFAYKYAIAVIKLDIKKAKNGKTEELVTYKEYTGTFRCSDECRKSSLGKIGIKWDPNKKPEERWAMQAQKQGTIPLIVPPAALEIVESKLQEMSENSTTPVAESDE